MPVRCLGCQLTFENSRELTIHRIRTNCPDIGEFWIQDADRRAQV